MRFASGVSRRTAFGEDVTVLREGAVSAYILVRKHLGTRLWTWRVETNLEPRLQESGSVLLSGPVSLLIQPPQVLDRSGKAITPGGSRWQLAREGSGWRLGFRLDDSRLPLPYAISG